MVLALCISITVNQQSLRVFACFGRVISPYRARLLTYVCVWMGVPAVICDSPRSLQAKLGCILFKEALGWVQAGCIFPANILIYSEYVTFLPLFTKLMVEEGENV